MTRRGTPALRRGAVLFFIVAVASLAASCHAPPSGDTVLKFWAMGREGEVVTQLLPEFERTHPGVRVDVQQLPWTAAHEKLLTAFAGDSTPDVCQLGNTWIPEFVALGAIAPLDLYVAQSREVDPADYFGGIWQTNIVGATLYGVPWYVDTRLLFYRRDLLAQAGFTAPPTSWQEWTRMMAAIKERAGPDHYAVLLPLNEFEPLLALALQQGEPLLRDDGRWGNFESTGFRRALKFYVDAFRNGFAPALSGVDISNVWNEFARGYFVFYISGPWNIAEFKQRLPASIGEVWTTAPLPGPTGPGASIAGGSSLVVFRRSQAKDAAWQLIEYLSRPDIQRRFHELTGDLPPRRGPWAGPPLADDPYARAFRDQLERARPAPRVAEWERIANEMRLVAERAVIGQLSIDEAVRELDARADDILEKRRWMLARGNLP